MHETSTTSPRTPRDRCRERLEEHLASSRRLRRRLKRLVRTRTFFIFTMVGYAVIDRTATFLVVPLVILLIPVVFVQHALARRSYRERLAVGFYRNALARMEDRWQGRGDDGLRYLTSMPLFADDLDLFGRGSLFQYLCAARTSVGKDTLADWLLQPAAVTEIRSRQEAVEELSQRLDLREQLAVLELDRSRFRPDVLSQWGTADDPLPGSIARSSGIVLAVVALGLWSLFGFGLWLILGIVLVELALCRLWRRRLQSITGPAVEVLQAHQALAVIRRSLQRVSFDSPLLRQLRTTIRSQAGSPILHVVYSFAVRRPLLLLIAGQFTSEINRWRAQVADQTRRRLLAWGQLEALASLAQYRFEQPEAAFPELVDDSLCYEATGIGHPLIPAARRVANDVTLNDSLRLLIVSGSNMSGKSTMLRTVGVNAVLARCGAPVCARRLRMTPFSIGTAMRFRDSLENQTSHFHAVITRLHEIMQLPADGRPLLFLIDEILQGTNSRDRLTGAEALARALIESNAVGMITTHDLELTTIVDSLARRAANVHFVDQLVGDELEFDYIMRPGVVQSSNALVLMRKLGLDV